MAGNGALGTILLAGLVLSGCGTIMSRYESPPYRVTLEEENFQIREYPELLVAVTESSSEDSGFRRIFSFISGENSRNEKISMTVPVRTQTSAEQSTMAFFMPKQYSQELLPAPLNEKINISAIKGGTFAALRFSGRTQEEQLNEKLGILSDWIKQRGYKPEGSWYLDRYDPPWTLPFLRTNEVLIRVSRAPG